MAGMDEPPKPRSRRWNQVSLRTLLVLVAIASIPFGWLGYKVRQAQRRAAAVKALRGAGNGGAL